MSFKQEEFDEIVSLASKIEGNTIRTEELKRFRELLGVISLDDNYDRLALKYGVSNFFFERERRSENYQIFIAALMAMVQAIKTYFSRRFTEVDTAVHV